MKAFAKWWVLATLVACGGEESSATVDASVTDTSVADSTSATDVGADTEVDAAADVVADAQPDAPVFDVKSISGLVLWLEASQKITAMNGVVSNWGDLSGNGNDAAQATQAYQPTFVPSVINNRPALHFAQGVTTGHVLVIPDAPSLNWGTNDYAIWVVAQWDNDPNDPKNGQATLFNKFKVSGQYGLPAPFLYANGGTNNQPSGGVTAGGGSIQVLYGAKINDLAPRSIATVRTGKTIEIRVNGVSVAQQTAAQLDDVSNVGSPARIGGEIGQYRRLNGDIAEVIAFQGTLTLQNISDIESYLKKKYAL
jgi:hypothetical protein